MERNDVEELVNIIYSLLLGVIIGSILTIFIMNGLIFDLIFANFAISLFIIFIIWYRNGITKKN